MRQKQIRTVYRHMFVARPKGFPLVVIIYMGVPCITMDLQSTLEMVDALTVAIKEMEGELSGSAAAPAQDPSAPSGG